MDGSSAYVLHVSSNFSTPCYQAQSGCFHLQSNADSSITGQWLWDHVQSTEHEKHLEWECRCPTHVLLSCSGPGSPLCSSESQLISFKAIPQSHLIIPRISARSLYAQALGSRQEGAHKLSGPLRARCDHREWQNSRILPYAQHAQKALNAPSDRGWKFPHPWLSSFLHTGVPMYLGGWSFE